jgi:hypothetical protein
LLRRFDGSVVEKLVVAFHDADLMWFSFPVNPNPDDDPAFDSRPLQQIRVVRRHASYEYGIPLNRNERIRPGIRGRDTGLGIANPVVHAVAGAGFTR